MGKEAFIASGVAIACLVDLTRLPTYLRGGALTDIQEQWPLLIAATLAAFIGAWWGRKLIHKVTMRAVQVTVGLLILAIAIFLSTGII
jgi:uncharacterized membrane protein YfcA